MIAILCAFVIDFVHGLVDKVEPESTRIPILQPGFDVGHGRLARFEGVAEIGDSHRYLLGAQVNFQDDRTWVHPRVAVCDDIRTRLVHSQFQVVKHLIVHAGVAFTSSFDEIAQCSQGLIFRRARDLVSDTQSSLHTVRINISPLGKSLPRRAGRFA